MNNIMVLKACFARKKIELTLTCLRIRIISVFKNAFNLFNFFDVRLVPFLDSNLFYDTFNNFLWNSTLYTDISFKLLSLSLRASTRV